MSRVRVLVGTWAGQLDGTRLCALNRWSYERSGGPGHHRRSLRHRSLLCQSRHNWDASRAGTRGLPKSSARR